LGQSFYSFSTYIHLRLVMSTAANYTQQLCMC